MKVKYFAETDTLYIECSDHAIVESRDLDENTGDAQGCELRSRTAGSA